MCNNRGRTRDFPPLTCALWEAGCDLVFRASGGGLRVSTATGENDDEENWWSVGGKDGWWTVRGLDDEYTRLKWLRT